MEHVQREQGGHLGEPHPRSGHGLHAHDLAAGDDAAVRSPLGADFAGQIIAGEVGNLAWGTAVQAITIAFMVYQNEFLGFDIYGIGFVLLLAAAVMTIWSMIVYLRAAWPYMHLDREP